MILSCQGISKTFPQKTIFNGASFILGDHEKAAIVGSNGTGKSTLMKIIMGKETPDDGTVTFAKDTGVGYLAQEYEEDSDLTIYELMLSARPELIEAEEKLASYEAEMHALQACADTEKEKLDRVIAEYTKLHEDFDRMGGYSYKSLLIGMLKGLGFSEEAKDARFNTLSGGQKTRAHLAKLLFSAPDLILLDEPTNHLDIAATRWLEDFLKNYKGAVLIVSHDRYFLDAVVDKIVAIEERGLTTYQGNYTAYAEKSRMLYDAKLAAYYKQEAEIAHQEAVIKKLRSFNREKSIKRAESREKKLDRMERISRPEVLRDQMRLTLSPEIESGKDVLIAEHLSKAFGDNRLFADQSFMLKRGEHVGIIGKNGTGKTTLLKLLTGLSPCDEGTVTLGSKVQVGYYDQEHQELNSDNTLFGEISDAYPTLDRTKIRNTLAAFLFTGEDVEKKVSALSGGEKGRLSLAKLMLSGANFLILDEPTNHLDIASREILENALDDYDGTLLFVSHDRYFINRAADRILELEDHAFHEYLGNYDYYLEKKMQLEGAAGTDNAAPAGSRTSAAAATADEGAATGRSEWEKQKAEQAVLRKQQNELKKCEAEIEKLETELDSVKEQLADPKNGTDLPLLQELSKKMEQLEEELAKQYAAWEQLME